MIVYVINKHGRALMPCSPRKARLLLRDKKAEIISYYGKRGFVNGFANSGIYVTDIHGNYICGEGKEHKVVPKKHVRVTGHNNNWRYGQFISPLIEAGEFLQ